MKLEMDQNETKSKDGTALQAQAAGLYEWSPPNLCLENVSWESGTLAPIHFYCVLKCTHKAQKVYGKFSYQHDI